MMAFTWDKASGNAYWYSNNLGRLWLSGKTVTLTTTGPGSTLRIGARGDGPYYNGLMDEIEISSVARSSNWLWRAG